MRRKINLLMINKLEDFFNWVKRTKLVELSEIDVLEDPVRPDLDMDFRTSHGRKIYGLKEGNEIVAVICFAFTNDVPQTVYEMDELSRDAHLQSHHRAGQQGSIAVAYTVWSRKKGGGKKIVQEVSRMMKKQKHLDRLVTLSPLTDMAERFHTRNGAVLLQKNHVTQNFEYPLDR